MNALVDCWLVIILLTSDGIRTLLLRNLHVKFTFLRNTQNLHCMNPITFFILLAMQGMPAFVNQEGVMPLSIKNQDEPATIIIYRPKHTYGFMWNIRMNDDRGRSYKVRNNSVDTLHVEPGPIRFTIKDIGRGAMELDLVPGETYFIKVYLRAGVVFGVPEVLEVTQTTAFREYLSNTP